MRAWWLEVKKVLVGGMTADYATIEAALKGMTADGGEPSRVFTLTEDGDGLYVANSTFTSASRVTQGRLIEVGVARFTWTGATAGGDNWSNETRIPFSEVLDGRIPTISLIPAVDFEPTIKRVVQPHVVTTGAGTFDVNASRAIARCYLDPITNSSTTRWVPWIAVA